MKKRNLFIFSLLLASLFLVFLSSPVNAVCCEKTVQGAWCQDDVASNCEPGYESTPSVCERTAYCRTGTCIDSSEGRCISNTPQTLCQEQGGTWDERAVEEIPQCQIGCCFFENGDTSPLTLNRCKAVAGMKGLEVSEYRTDITDQIQCLAMATSPEIGACVIDNEIERDCKQTTRQECNALSSSGVTTEFTEGYLCSADFLGTICGKSKKTTCVEDMVYFVDTCGNIANVYDASKADDQSYWNKIIAPEDSCQLVRSSRDGFQNTASCGNCDYGAGSYCQSYERGINEQPTYGNFVCSDLGCKIGDLALEFRDKNGRFPYHGESWCATNAPVSLKKMNPFLNNFAPGEESYRLYCYNGEVSYDEVSRGESRQTICVEEVDSEAGIHYGGKVVNEWMGCWAILDQETCENSQERDCKWVFGNSILKDENLNPLSKDKNGNPIEASCVPRYSPASDFWKPESNVSDVCSSGSTMCTVRYEIGLYTNAENFGTWSQETKLGACVENCYCLEGYEKGKTPVKDKNEKDYEFDSYEEWISSLNNICHALGDCGTELNYIKEEGRYDSNDAIVDSEYFKKRKEFEEWANKQ
jgi:hypothetical protein